MNKKIKIFTTIMLFIAAISLYVVRPNNKTLASNNLQVMTTSSGTELKYRNSSEKVYGLAKYDYPTAEYRAAWVSTFVGDIPSFTTEEKFKSDATIVLDNLVKMGMNAIVFDVRTHNNALYPSDLNPVASWWNVVDFDSLEYILTVAFNLSFYSVKAILQFLLFSPLRGITNNGSHLLSSQPLTKSKCIYCRNYSKDTSANSGKQNICKQNYCRINISSTSHFCTSFL